MPDLNHCPQCGCNMPPDAPAGLCPECLLGVGLGMSEPDYSEQPVTEVRATPGFVPPKPKDIAGRFPQFEILDLLGYGGMGAVYKARQKSLDRLVALKIIKPEAADDRGFSERFVREAKALARLNHSTIVGVYDFGESNGLYYFVMEYVDGTNLRRLIESKELSPQQALQIVPQVCEALQFAHDEGIVHRDIKPENILVDTKGRVKIADFGLAKLLGKTAIDEHTLTGTHQVMGTPRYMAPEQLEGSRTVDHRADIYSLGVVFYEMLTGEVPMGSFEPPSRKVRVDARLDEVVLRSLAKEPERRYQHASDVRTDLAAIDSPIMLDKQLPSRLRSFDGNSVADSRFSRKAIVGACWIPLFFVGVLAALMPWVTIEVHHGSAEPPARPLWRYILVATITGVGLVGVIAPFLTTILGFVAISDVRHSDGRLRGLGLALFDALFFPLLAVDALIAIGILRFMPIHVFLSPAMVVIVVTLTNVPFVYWCWRRASSDGRSSNRFVAESATDWSPLVGGFCVLVPLLALIAFAMVYVESAWVLASLIVPWVTIGIAGVMCDGKPQERAINVIALVAFLLSLALIGLGVWVEHSAWPLMGLAVGLGAAVIGMLIGVGVRNSRNEESKSVATPEDDEEPTIDEEEESPKEKLEWVAWWIGLVGAVRSWALLTTGGSTLDKIFAGDTSLFNHELFLQMTGPVMVIAAIAAYHARLYWLAVAGAILCMATGNCVPVICGLYSLVALFDPKVRALFLANEAMLSATGSTSDSPHATAKPPMPRGYGDAIGSTLTNAWTEWWRERDAMFTRGMQSVIMLLHIACLLAFLGFTTEGGTNQDGEHVFKYNIGFPSPWLTIETKASHSGFSFHHEVHWTIAAWFVAGVGLGLAYIYCRIEKVRNPEITFWHKPETFMLIWALLAAADMLLGAGMGHLSMNLNRSDQTTPRAHMAAGKEMRDTNPVREQGKTESNKHATPSLIEAVARGDIRQVKAALDAGASVNEKDAQGRTLLMSAIAGGHRSLALTLVVLGADLTEQDDKGRTALMVAVEAQDKVFLSRLRELQQITYEPDANERKAELRAFSGVERSMLEGRDFDLRMLSVNDLEFQANANGETASLIAARIGDWELFSNVATHIESLRARNENKRTIAMTAAIAGHVSWFERLTLAPYFGKAGSDNLFVGQMLAFDVTQLALTDGDGKTALQLAEENDQTEIADILRRHLQAIVDSATAEINKGGDDVSKHQELRRLALQALDEADSTDEK